MANSKAGIRFGTTTGNDEALIVSFRLEFISEALSKRVEKSFNQKAALWLDEKASNWF